MVSAVVIAATIVVAAGPAGATTWLVSLGPGSAGEAQALGAPAAPTGVTAACGTGTNKLKITVSWSAVPKATSYTVYESTTSSTSGFSAVASGVTTTSWTSANLATGHKYWFEVAALIGSKWTSVPSSSTGSSTVNGSGCTQP
jgi:hypothetical protein